MPVNLLQNPYFRHLTGKLYIMLNLILFGPPGAGKGTQSSLLVERYDLVHLSTGDIFRANIKAGTELGVLAKQYIDAGQLVPDEVTIGMLEAEVNRHPNTHGFIFDGFPRTTAQAQALDAFLATKNAEISAVVALEVPEEELKVRLLERAKTSGRTDDADPAVIEKRIAVYRNETEPVKAHYAAKDRYIGVDGVGHIHDITKRLSKAIDKLIA